MYYELDRYYQNHKRYVRSRDDSQTGSGEGGSSKCAPQQYVNGSANPDLPHNGEINPCGLIAWSFFNDSYTAAVVGPDGAPVPLELDVSPFTHHPFCRRFLCNSEVLIDHSSVNPSVTVFSKIHSSGMIDLPGAAIVILSIPPRLFFSGHCAMLCMRLGSRSSDVG